MRPYIAALIVICGLVLTFPANAMADCSGSGSRVGAVVTAPVRALRAVGQRIRNRERKPLVTGVRWLFRR